MAHLALFLLFLTTWGPWAAADEGFATGGGGGAFVCRDQAGAPLQAEFLDLWNARHLPNLKDRLEIEVSMAPVQEQIQEALQRMAAVDPAFAERVGERIRFYQMLKNQVRLPEDVVLAPPQDAQNAYGKKDCPLEGMMFRDPKTGLLSFKEDIYAALETNTDKAAAWVHEGVDDVLKGYDGKGAHPARGRYTPVTGILKTYHHRVEELTYGVFQGNERSPSSTVSAQVLTACLFSSKSCFDQRPLEDKLPRDVRVTRCQSEEDGFDFFHYKKERESKGRIHFLILKTPQRHFPSGYSVHFDSQEQEQEFLTTSTRAITFSRQDYFYGGLFAEDAPKLAFYVALSPDHYPEVWEIDTSYTKRAGRVKYRPHLGGVPLGNQVCSEYQPGEPVRR